MRILSSTLAALCLAAMFFVPAAGAADVQKVTLTLDWTPNPDHIGFYYARERGLFAKARLEVGIRAPSDPTAPLKLVALGRSDLAVSYEQELFFAAARKLPVIAVAAVVPQPLNSIMAIEPQIRSLSDLRGRTIGITGVPSDFAALDTALATARLTRKDVKVVSVGYSLLPALLAGRVDAVLGMYRNVEGIELRLRGYKPTIIPLNQAGVPFYDELVLVANASRIKSDPRYARAVGRFVNVLLDATELARHDRDGSLAILRKVTAADSRFLEKSTPATLDVLAGPNGIGCMRKTQWQKFGEWMRTQSLLDVPIPIADVMTTRFLPRRCLEPS
jgi:putative hydroxymethylpyrimidine transport system substrate-binding protein